MGEASASARIDRLIASIGDWRGDRIAQIRRLMREADPEMVEEWKWMGTPVWCRDGIVALANPHKGKVKIMFAHGAHISDPHRLFNASLEGNEWRAVDLFEADAIDEPALKELIRVAVKFNRSKIAGKAASQRRPSRARSPSPRETRRKSA